MHRRGDYNRGDYNRGDYDRGGDRDGRGYGNGGYGNGGYGRKLKQGGVVASIVCDATGACNDGRGNHYYDQNRDERCFLEPSLSTHDSLMCAGFGAACYSI